MRTIDRELPLRHSRFGLVRHSDFAYDHRTFFIPVFVKESIALLLHRLKIFVDGIDTAGSVHPAHAVVESLVDEELSPGGGAIGIEPLITHHLQFGAEKEVSMGIDQKQSVMIDSICRRNRNAVRSAFIGMIVLF